MQININKIKKDVISHKYLYLSFLCVYVLAIIIGIFFSTEIERFFLTENIIVFYKNILTKEGSLFGLIFSRLFGDIATFFLFFGIAMVTFLFPVNYVIIFYRGYILGAVAGIFVSTLSVSGIMLYVFAVLIPDIITTVCLCFFAVESFYIQKKKCKNAISKILTILALSWVVSLIGLIIELIFILCFIRPLNFNF